MTRRRGRKHSTRFSVQADFSLTLLMARYFHMREELVNRRIMGGEEMAWLEEDEPRNGRPRG